MVYCSNLDDIDLYELLAYRRKCVFVCQSLINIKFPTLYSIPQTAFEYTLWEQSAPDGVLYAGDFAYKIIGSDFTDSTLTFKDDTYAINDDFLSYNEYVKNQFARQPYKYRYPL